MLHTNVFAEVPPFVNLCDDLASKLIALVDRIFEPMEELAYQIDRFAERAQRRFDLVEDRLKEPIFKLL